MGFSLKKFLFWKRHSAPKTLFRAIAKDDADVDRAHELAAETIDRFVELVQEDTCATHMAKLRFRDSRLVPKALSLKLY